LVQTLSSNDTTG